MHINQYLEEGFINLNAYIQKKKVGKLMNKAPSPGAKKDGIRNQRKQKNIIKIRL